MPVPDTLILFTNVLLPDIFWSPNVNTETPLKLLILLLKFKPVNARLDIVA